MATKRPPRGQTLMPPHPIGILTRGDTPIPLGIGLQTLDNGRPANRNMQATQLQLDKMLK